MKMHSSILLLFVSTQLVSTAPIAAKSGMFSDKKKFIDEMNTLRKQHAELEQIGNMHEMRYDDALERKAKLRKSCNVIEIMKTEPWEPYIIFPLVEGTDVLRVVMRFFVLHTKIGCAELSDPCVDENQKLTAICLIGPINESQTYEIDMKKGPPGSLCPFGSSEGLCTPTL